MTPGRMRTLTVVACVSVVRVVRGAHAYFNIAEWMRLSIPAVRDKIKSTKDARTFLQGIAVNVEW